MKYLLILLFSFPVYAQTQVKISKEDQKKYGLKKTVDDTYLIYTFDEAKDIKKKDAKLEACTKKVEVLKKEVDLRGTQVKAARAALEKVQENNLLLEQRSIRLTKKYHECLDEKAAIGTDWVPWLITAASIAVALAGWGTAGYYMAKEKLK
jgi:hypothetical protein